MAPFSPGAGGTSDSGDFIRRLQAKVQVGSLVYVEEDDLTPGPGDEVNTPRPTVSAVIQGPAGYIDVIVLTVDGDVVAHKYNDITKTVSYSPTALL